MNFYEELDQVYAEGDPSKVEVFLKEKNAEFLAAGEGSRHEYALSMDSLACLYRGLSRFPEAIDAFKIALSTLKEEAGDRTVDYATVLNNMAGAYRMSGDAEEALALFTESMGIYDSIPEKNDYLYAGVLNNIALLYESKGELEQSISYAKQAIVHLGKIEGLADELATTKTNLAGMYIKLGEYETADKILDEALTIFANLPGGQSAHLSAALNNKAMLASRRGDTSQAKQLLLQAREEVKQYFGENVDYAAITRNLARLCEKHGDESASKKYWKEAAELFENILGVDHQLTVEARDEAKA
jgi:tetratricopeptide (TPR) repeat protein